MEKFIVKYKGVMTLIITAERDKDKVTFEQACEDIYKDFNDKLTECLKVDVEVSVSENDCTSLCAHIAQALDDAFDSFGTVIKKMNLTMVKEEEDNEDHV